MEREIILPVLYDLAVTIGSEISVKPLLTRTLQRLLYHTSFSAGFICLDAPVCDKADGLVEVHLDAVVGDFDLIGEIGKSIYLPGELICQAALRETDQAALLSVLRCTQTQYKAYLRLPIDHCGVIVLLAAEMPETKLPLTTMLQPVLAHLARAIMLCRSNDKLIAEKEVTQARAEHSLHQSERSFSALLELSPIGVLFSSEGTTLGANHAFLRMFGYELDEIRGRPFLEMVAPQSREAMLDRVKKRAQGIPVEQSYEITGLRKDGAEIPLLVSANRMELDEGPRTTAFVVDLTELKRAEKKYRTLYDSTSDAVMLLDTHGFFDCNKATLDIFGCATQAEFCSKHPSDLAPPQQPCGTDSLVLANEHIATALKIGSHRFEWVHRRADNGKDFPAEVLLNAMELDGKPVLQATVRDITERKQNEQKIYQLAFYDSLTNLPNRRLLMDRLRQAFSVGARSGQHGALLFLDLDNFKTLNDTKGHDIGDLLLAEVAKRLNACVRDGDTVARLGGDEFVVVLDALSAVPDEAAAQADLVAEKIRDILSQPYQLGNYEHHTTPSIGVVLFRGHLQSVDDVLKYADTAMYQAKSAGRNTIRFYDPLMQAAIEARADLEEELRHALEREQLCLHYQIQMDSRNRPLGAEVLLRWQHPRRGLVSPAQFIPLAEDTGHIVPIGLWVLQTACAQLKSWQNDALTRDLTLAVNVSAKQFRSKNFVAQVQRVLVETGAKPALLKLELTESIVLENVEDTIAKMRELKLLGVSFSMDDFGTGYSSLQYLKRLPLDQIKIDQSFVRDIVSDPNDAAIVQTIIAMSEVLGLSVIAEGVETEAQREFLDLRGCHAFQGYLFGKPVLLPDFEARLRV
jgi:diguanylate cyclase (GGDEF)-like protein/PAS domain S-box-containing protein